MSKRSCYDEEDKSCLLQVLSLLNNLEALSHDHEMVHDDSASMDLSVVSHLYRCDD
jgi:hypothetical protein